MQSKQRGEKVVRLGPFVDQTLVDTHGWNDRVLFLVYETVLRSYRILQVHIVQIVSRKSAKPGQSRHVLPLQTWLSQASQEHTPCSSAFS